MGKESFLDHSRSKFQVVDRESGNPIRPTDNGLKEGDLQGINQDNKPLELDENGLPKGWKAP